MRKPTRNYDIDRLNALLEKGLTRSAAFKLLGWPNSSAMEYLDRNYEFIPGRYSIKKNVD